MGAALSKEQWQYGGPQSDMICIEYGGCEDVGCSVGYFNGGKDSLKQNGGK